MIDFNRMAEEHERLFPKASAESQFHKMEEEISELEDAKTPEQRLKERADIMIVCAGLYRWFPKTAVSLAEHYWWNGVEEKADRKWQINLKRKWEWNGKTYHHVGKDGEE